MTQESKKEGIEESAALYALGALSQIEARAFEHSQQQATTETVAQFETVVALIGLSVPEAEPSEFLRDILMNRIEKEAQRAEHSQSQPIATPAPFALQNDSWFQSRSDEEDEVATASLEPPSRFRTLIPWAIAASWAIIALGFFFFWRQADQQTIQLQQQLAAAQRNNSNEELAQIKAALSNPDSRVIQMAGQEAAPVEGELGGPGSARMQLRLACDQIR